MKCIVHYDDVDHTLKVNKLSEIAFNKVKSYVKRWKSTSGLEYTIALKNADAWKELERTIK